ncbi:MAG TPA: beta-L-arabinofuranosidase domain-containing protein [Bacteroidales bacterium]|nr:beta-L-arabinofuranosidase domain-containing protein [Bacteroidales bacterium]
MNRSILLLLVILFTGCSREKKPALYLQNRAPLIEKTYLELPLGAIKPRAWLLDQLIRQKNGLTGHLDEVYSQVVGPRNGWLGGHGDGWERGPYWIDGLLPLAYILDDSVLKAKVKPWIEWTLNNQREDGYLGPVPFKTEPPFEPGLQKSQREDWWPKMVMLKVLMQYYNATSDPRVIKALTAYFRYQLKTLPETPLDHWTFWANQRGGDNMMVVYWLYNITGDPFLLELTDLLAKQTFPWTTVFLNKENYTELTSPWQYFDLKTYPFDTAQINSLTVSQMGGMHGVNLCQGIKEPLVYYQQHPDRKYYNSVKKAFLDIRKYHGQPQGMFAADEGLHGKNPVQGIEFCSIAEMMFSLETMLAITGDMEFADQVEKIAYNALPTQASDDFNTRQYFQSANQVELSDRLSVSYLTTGHQYTDYVFGLLSGYPCCTSNMHQAWPKFVQNMWYATTDRGVAALLYGPSEVSLLVGDSIKAHIIETTGYPFWDNIRFSVKLDKSGRFPFHLRMPSWSAKAEISINNTPWNGEIVNHVAIIDREWKNGDEIYLKLPMQMKCSRWYDFAASIERGPLVYALKIDAESKIRDRKDQFGPFTEFYPTSKWNFALYSSDLLHADSVYQIQERHWEGDVYPWNLENCPVSIIARAADYPEWQLQNGIPVFPAWWGRKADEKELVPVTLVPYGCTTLRITEFPVFERSN